MKKVALTFILALFLVAGTHAQSGSLNSDIVNISWYSSGSTVYYSIDVESPGTFYQSMDPEGRDNSVWFICDTDGSVIAFEIIYNSANFPYGPASYNGSFSVAGHNVSSLDFSAGASFMTSTTTVEVESWAFGL